MRHEGAQGTEQVERWRRVLYAEVQATGRAIESLRSVPEGSRAGGPYAEACRRLAHVQMARHEWLARLGHVERRPWVQFPEWDVETTRADAARLDALWSGYLASLVDAELRRPVHYASTEGTPWSNTVDDILTHVFNHSTYHRGQIAMLVRAAGGEPASTDYIVLTRTRREA